MHVDRIPIESREQWLVLRKTCVTASDVAAACGVSPYKTPAALYAEKLGLVEDIPDNALMRRGRLMEPLAVEYLKIERPTWRTIKAGVFLHAPDLGIGATPDVVAIDPERDGIGIVQVKIVARPVFTSEWRGGDRAAEPAAPLHYALQTITEAKLAGASWACLAALVVSDFYLDLHIVDVPIRDDVWGRIVADVAWFRRCIAERRMPDIDPAVDAETVKRVYAREDVAAPVLDLASDNELPVLLAEREEIKAREKIDKARLEAIDTIVKARMGEHALATLPGWSITWKSQNRKGYVVEPTTVRVLNVKQTAPKEIAA